MLETILTALIVQTIITIAGSYVTVHVLRAEMKNVREWLSAHEKRDDSRFSEVSRDVRDIRNVLIEAR